MMQVQEKLPCIELQSQVASCQTKYFFLSSYTTQFYMTEYLVSNDMLYAPPVPSQEGKPG